MDAIEAGTRWVHKREGYAVVIEGSDYGVKMKAADAANWDDAVGYRREDEMEEDPGTVYVRAEDDFRDKFEPETEFDAGDEDEE